MGYKHGIYGYENPTSLVPSVATGNLVVVVGTAAINNANTPKVNEPILCYSMGEYVENFGAVNDIVNYTLAEAADVFFSKFGVGPVVFINVLDPTIHKKAITDEEVTLVDDIGILADKGAMKDNIVVKNSAGDVTYEKETDYLIGLDSDGNTIISKIDGGSLTTPLKVTYSAIDPSMIDKDDIIGGIDVSTGGKTGFELVEDIFPKFRLIPSIAISPKFSYDSEVAAVMDTKMSLINGVFKGITVTDVPTGTIKKYSDVPKWKNDNNYVNEDQIVCWPKVKLGDKQYHMSTQVAALMCQVDYGNQDIPYESPSNKLFKMDGLVLEDETEVVLDLVRANYLNGNGILTALNFIGGWKAWGNRTACYPSNIDPKDSFIPAKRMFYWNNNRFIQTYWNDLDKPMVPRRIDKIIDSDQVFLDGLKSGGYILGGEIEFRESDNPTTSLLDGIGSFFTYFSPPVPFRAITYTQEYNPSYLETLFG